MVSSPRLYVTYLKLMSMAVLKSGINGHFSGKVGDVIGYQVKGRQIIRGLPRKKTGKPTKKELLNRMKFAVAQKWLSPLVKFLRIGFANYQPTFEGFVAAKSYLLKNAMQIDENQQFFVDPALALVSFGTQELPASANAVCSGQQEVVFTWSTEGSHPYSDSAMVLVYAPHPEPRYEKLYFNTAIAKRWTGTATLKLQPNMIGRKIDVYLAFISDDRKKRSNSMYLGKLTVV